jgi:hypothetical protein
MVSRRYHDSERLVTIRLSTCWLVSDVYCNLQTTLPGIDILLVSLIIRLSQMPSIGTDTDPSRGYGQKVGSTLGCDLVIGELLLPCSSL